MKTIFKVGMVVYDQIFFGETPLKITEVKGDMTLRVLYGEVTYCYTGDGRFIGEDITSNRHRGLSQTPTLSTSPYTFDGFEQKTPIPTYEEVIKEARSKGDYYYLPDSLEAPSEELVDATIALLKLLFLRDYYNKGWQPDWKDGDEEKYCIRNFGNELCVMDLGFSVRVMAFRTPQIRDKFLEEQKELLEIAKPLL